MKPKTLLTLKLAAGLDLSSSACEDLHRMQRLALEALAEETSDLKTPAAPVPLPLGPNVLRDGRKARVLCNDFQNGGRCVIVALKTSSGNENTSYHFADGRVNLDGTDSPSDLVGQDDELERLRGWKQDARELLARAASTVSFSIRQDLLRLLDK